MVKDTQTIHRLLLTNCLSVFDHFVGLALKGLNKKVVTKYFTDNEMTHVEMKQKNTILFFPAQVLVKFSLSPIDEP